MNRKIELIMKHKWNCKTRIGELISILNFVTALFLLLGTVTILQAQNDRVVITSVSSSASNESASVTSTSDSNGDGFTDSITFFAVGQVQPNAKGDPLCSASGSTTVTRTGSFDLCLQESRNVSISGINDDGSNCSSTVNIRYFVVPLNVTLANPESNTTCFQDNTNLKATTNYNVNAYNWKYQLTNNNSNPNNNNWIDLGVSGSNVNLRLNDYIPNAPTTGRIWFRTVNCRGESSSNWIFYDIITCSPQLIEPNGFQPINTTCSYSDDGGFSMLLDRDLGSGKKLVVTLYKENPFIPDDFSELVGQEDTTILTDNGDNTYTYNWPTSIEGGTYKVKYQALNMGEDAALDSWDSLEFSPEFTIGSPDPLLFTVAATAVSCNDGSDGSIQLSAQGGSGNYEYFLDGATQGIPFTNTGTGTNSNPIIHNITGLPAGTKTIKVQDINGCTEQN